MNRVTVSFLIALYNKRKYVERAINSVLKESDSLFDIEVCVVDDGSTDGSYRFVEELYRDEPRVRISRFQKNRGKNAAYNLAFEKSAGKYISILGADDEVIPGRTHILFSAMNNKFDASWGGLEVYLESAGELVRRMVPGQPEFKKNIVQNQLSGGAFLMSRTLATQIFPIPVDLRFEDWWISFHALRLGSVVAVDTPVTLYRLHDGNDCGDTSESFLAMRADFERHLEYLDAFENYVSEGIEKRYLLKARALRESFFGHWKLGFLLLVPLDRFWLKTNLYGMVGPKLSHRIFLAAKRLKSLLSREKRSGLI